MSDESKAPKVYLVTFGIYSDYSVGRVFSTMALAEKWIGDRRDKHDTGTWGLYRIEEYSFDDMSGADENIHTGYYVEFYGDEISENVSKVFGTLDTRIWIIPYGRLPRGRMTKITVPTTDEQTARKAAQEIYMRLKALNRLGLSENTYTLDYKTFDFIKEY